MPAMSRWAQRFAPLIGLVIVALVFSILTGAPERYLSLQNLRVILAQTLIVGLGAIGMTFIIVSGGIDLSVGSVIALAGIVAALVLRDGGSPTWAIAAAVLTGAVVGAWNAMLVTRVKVIPFIATLGTLGAARGVAKWLAGERTVNIPDTWINELAVTFPAQAWMLVAPGIWLAAILAVIASLVLTHTVFGRRVYAIGSNEVAARAAGVAVESIRQRVYVLAGALVGLAGAMQMSRLRQGDPTVASGTELDIIAAVVIGGASLNGGEGGIAGSIIGALTMAFLRNGSQQMGWPSYVQEIIIGLIIVAAVALDRWRTRQRTA
ncbi:MAG: ABC transporter permease [Acidobacteria bacterium]|jgi:ribose transport system permease protein|nr:ABC transporter permease [Acidobacteriota bacterium]